MRPGGPTHVLLSDREAEHIPGCNMAFRREAARGDRRLRPAVPRRRRRRRRLLAPAGPRLDVGFSPGGDGLAPPARHGARLLAPAARLRQGRGAARAQVARAVQRRRPRHLGRAPVRRRARRGTAALGAGASTTAPGARACSSRSTSPTGAVLDVAAADARVVPGDRALPRSRALGCCGAAAALASPLLRAAVARADRGRVATAAARVRSTRRVPRAASDCGSRALTTLAPPASAAGAALRAARARPHALAPARAAQPPRSPAARALRVWSEAVGGAGGAPARPRARAAASAARRPPRRRLRPLGPRGARRAARRRRESRMAIEEHGAGRQLIRFAGLAALHAARSRSSLSLASCSRWSRRCTACARRRASSVSASTCALAVRPLPSREARLGRLPRRFRQPWSKDSEPRSQRRRWRGARPRRRARRSHVRSSFRASSRLLRYVRPHWRGLVVVIAAMLAEVGLELAPPWPLALLIDNVLGEQAIPAPGCHGPAPTARTVAAAWVVVAERADLPARARGRRWSTRSLATAGPAHDVSARRRPVPHLQRLSLLFHTRRAARRHDLRASPATPCCINTIVTGRPHPAAPGAGHADRHVRRACGSSQPTLTLLALGVAPFLVLVIRALGRPIKDRTPRAARPRGPHDVRGRAARSRAVPAVQAFTREEIEHRRFRDYADRTVRAYVRATMAGLLVRAAPAS